MAKAVHCVDRKEQGSLAPCSVVGGGGAEGHSLAALLVPPGSNAQAQVCRRTTRLLRSLLVLLGAGTAYAQLTVVEYPIPTPNSTPAHITAGPDGALWFTENAVGQVGRVTIDGSFSEFSVATVGTRPNGIVGGSDGAVWFTDSNAAAVGRITTSGAVTKYPISGPAGNPVNFQPGSSGGIVAGADGAIWTFVNSNSSPPEIVRITPEATTYYSLAAAGGGLDITGVLDITASPSDGAIWFTLSGNTVAAPVQSAPAVGRITASGVITIFPLPVGEGAGNIIAGPDGTIWFDIAGQIGRITTTGLIAGFPGTLGPYKTVAQGAVWTLSPEILNLVKWECLGGLTLQETLQLTHSRRPHFATLLLDRMGRCGLPTWGITLAESGFRPNRSPSLRFHFRWGTSVFLTPRHSALLEARHHMATGRSAFHRLA